MSGLFRGPSVVSTLDKHMPAPPIAHTNPPTSSMGVTTPITSDSTESAHAQDTKPTAQELEAAGLTAKRRSARTLRRTSRVSATELSSKKQGVAKKVPRAKAQAKSLPKNVVRSTVADGKGEGVDVMGVESPDFVKRIKLETETATDLDRPTTFEIEHRETDVKDIHGATPGPSNYASGGCASTGQGAEHPAEDFEPSKAKSLANHGHRESKSKGKLKAGDTPDESRMARYRVAPTVATRERAERVMSQRMFMVDRTRDPGSLLETFKVLGSTGNIYTVSISQLPRCDCPDCLKGNVPCKHIIFIFLKVLKVPQTSEAWYQKALLVRCTSRVAGTADWARASEIKMVFDQAPEDVTSSHIVKSNIKNAYLTATGQGVPGTTPEQKDTETASRKIVSVGEDCPVCYEEMTAEDDTANRLTYDDSVAGCGRALHKECFQQWSATLKIKREAVTCVWCRAVWPTEGTNLAINVGGSSVTYSSLGYMNMADLAGISRVRDTSSYYMGHQEHRYRDD